MSDRRSETRYGTTLFTDHDIYLFKGGTHFRLYDKLGSHILSAGGVGGTYFAVWAPNAREVSVIGDFNKWDKKAHPLQARWDLSLRACRSQERISPGVEKLHLQPWKKRSEGFPCQ